MTRPIQRYRHKFTPASPEQLLAAITNDEGEDPRKLPPPRLVQSSFGSPFQTPTTIAAKNGLINAAIEAYNEHHNLVLRPDDIWVAILTQLSAYVNANASDLRSKLVTHGDGQQGLHIEVELSPNLDHGAMAYEMTKLMSASLKDPELRDWILPAFSTTEKADQAVASIVFMGTMQKYFSYSWGTRCGIPAVNLLGEEDDWIEIAERCALKLGAGDFGPEAAKWYRVLRPVLAGFIETYRDPSGPAATRFWQGMVDEHKPNGSGRTTYSGWITAFCYWDEKGNCLHDSLVQDVDGARVVRLSRNQIPSGFTKVPVSLLKMGLKVPTEMVAGSVGMKVRKWEEDGLESTGRPTRDSQIGGGYNTLQPVSGWFMQYV
ncbi:hypothetical protein B0T14DRAFT_159944 [Immersiella caudata]|uniref:Uncharacterized protein n=1 Tax=Immersiella caudata TaxID=314043 RepID=A0AA39WWN5_9PEZI|nr:hypothetical protein B0T14DRAFT_159944 [Immersiella caudata]